jgi:hypothetical protein
MNLSHNHGGSQDSAAIQLLRHAAHQPIEIDVATGLPKFPAFDKNTNYIDEYWNLYQQNQLILA